MKTKLVLSIFALACVFALIASCQSEEEQTYNRYYSMGSVLYIQHCQNCHGTNAEGLGKLIPPFTDSAYLRKNLAQLPCFVKNGLKDTITVTGKTFSNSMPAQGNLSAIEIAEILTYVTNSFGNKMGLIAVGKVERDLAGCK